MADLSIFDEDTRKKLMQLVPAQRELICMLRTTGYGEEYSFEFIGTLGQAEAFVQNMRMCLSRFRKNLLSKGQSVQKFKILTVGIVTLENNLQRVTLKRTKSTGNFASEAVSLVLKELALAQAKDL